MNIHLVGGFLGSGKTTAITNASRIRSREGITTSIITNDQGHYLVDSMFIQSEDIPYAEVTGGCFCCNYSELADQIDFLKNTAKPSMIFAESVGSCTDLVATVLKPLSEFKKDSIERVTLSTFADVRLLLPFLKGDALPFEDDTNYIWKKQFEESGILIANKIDLVSREELGFIDAEIKTNFPAKILIFQNSLDVTSVEKWIEVLDNPQTPVELKSIDVDYEKYGSGEANLAWLDESIEFISNDHSALNIAERFINDFSHSILDRSFPVGHLKFLLYCNNKSYKFSFTALQDDPSPEVDFREKSNRALLVVNARIQCAPDELRNVVACIVGNLQSEYPVDIIENNISFFQPGFPKPTHRFA